MSRCCGQIVNEAKREMVMLWMGKYDLDPEVVNVLDSPIPLSQLLVEFEHSAEESTSHQVDARDVNFDLNKFMLSLRYLETILILKHHELLLLTVFSLPKAQQTDCIPPL